MDGKSLDLNAERIQQLKNLFPEAFTEGKVDWEKLKATLGEDIEFRNERYVLNWAGKSDAFHAMQAPTTKTLVPAKDESVDFDQTENLFVEGENLEVLKVLQKSYFNQVKMIYIDPPYNTGNDHFIYPDKFAETKEEYLKRVGDKDEEGYMTKEGLFRKNSKENGQYHSNWLNMMYPRLFLARNLLREDGVIFVSIDDNEAHNLRLLMNEVFGEENFVAQFIWEKRITRENRKVVSVRHDYILLFAKNLYSVERIIGLLEMDEEAISRYKNPDNDPRGVWTSVPAIAQAGHGTKSQFYTMETPSGRKVDPPSGSCWRYTKTKMDEAISDNRIWFGSDGNGVPRIKKFLNEGQQGLTPETIWWAKDVGTNDTAKRELTKLFDSKAVFETPKPSTLIKRMLQLSTTNKDVCLDFFSGSSPFSEAVLSQNKEDGGNRKFICVQLPEACEPKSEAYKAGYATIADIAKERIRRVIAQLKEGQNGKIDFEGNPPDWGFKVFKLSESNFKQWQTKPTTPEELTEQMKLFINPVVGEPTPESMLTELMIKAGLDLNSEIEAKDGFYAINGTELFIVLEGASEAMFARIAHLQPQKVIALDKSFNQDDPLKTNIALQMKDAGIDFKTI